MSSTKLSTQPLTRGTAQLLGLRLEMVEAVVLLIEERNFSRAAQRVPLSQPAFSRRISLAERALGQRLFTRTSRRVQPTQACLDVLPLMVQLLDCAGGLVTALRDCAHGATETT